MTAEALRVLYLAPPRRRPGMLTAFSFLDEEIVALAGRGIELIVPGYPGGAASDPAAADHPGIRLHALPPGTAPGESRRTLALLARARRLVPASGWREPARLYHAARIEAFAARLATAHSADVIHSHFGWPDGFGGALCRAVTGLPLVATMRGMDVLVDPDIHYGLRRDPRYHDALSGLLRVADLTTHVSDFIRTRAISLGADPRTARTILKGVDCARFHPDAGDAGAPHGRPVVLTVAGLIRRKGVDGILRALAKLAASRDFSFVVAGDGPERQNLEALCDALSLRDRTTFLGQVPRERIAALFAASDVFVLGSLQEASGNVLVEALASGRPVVCTDSGGPPEYVEHGQTGFVVPVGDADAMAARIAGLLDDPALRRDCGARARERALERFGYPRMLDQIVATYREAAGLRAAAGPQRAARAQ